MISLKSRNTLLDSVADALRCGEVPPSPPTVELENEHNRVLIDTLTAKVKALAASEERFRQMAESITDVFWLSDPANTEIFYVNPAYEMIWGRSCESLYASPRSWAEAIHPEDRPRIRDGETWQFVEGGDQHTYRIIRPGGAIRWIHSQTFPVRDESGQLIRVAGLAKDITRQQWAEQEQAKSQQRFLTLFRASPMAIGYGSVQDGRLIDVNDKYAHIFGCRREEMLGRTDAELKLWTDFQERTRNLNLLLNNGKVENVEARFQRKSGEEFEALVSMELIPIGDEPVLITMLVDVTDWKKAQREVATRARQQQAVAELGQHALAKISLTALFDETTVLVARALEVEFCKVFQLLPDMSGLKLVAGLGWREGLVGQAVVGTGSDSQAGYTLQCGNPVIIEDLRTETRFRSPRLLHDHGVVSGVSVIIASLTEPWGVLGADTGHKRTFTKDDINFVQSVANVLGAAIARHEAEQSLLNLSARLMHAEDAERRRIAKELHDSTAQDLVAVILNLESLRDHVAARNPAEATQLEDSLALLENCAHEIRTLSYLLHPPRLDEAGLAGAIHHYVAGFGERTGIATSVDFPANLDRLGETVERVLFRVVQECLGNIHRHAGSATASLRLTLDASGIVLEVRDEGQGIPPQILGTIPGQFTTAAESRLEPAGRCVLAEPNKEQSLNDSAARRDGLALPSVMPDSTAVGHFTGLGVGIPGMRERLRQIGGHLEIDSSPRGTTVRAVAPGRPQTAGRNPLTQEPRLS